MLVKFRSFFLISLITVGLVSCSKESTAQFGWNSFYDQDLPDLERSLLQPTSFQLGRDNLYFSDQNTIWWIYRIDEVKFAEKSLLVALYSVSGSPEPVEIDLREVSIEYDDENPILRQYYNPLPIGQYRLKIARGSEPFDSVDFQVIPADELTMSSGPLPGDQYRDSFTDDIEDDIAKYSKEQ
ncbi:MAG: hypothetical protein H3C43_02425 [Leptonema sp. (in: Bacteria)]|nr:hypothetical protein [Leptonema sp. (in: bacteria)]